MSNVIARAGNIQRTLTVKRPKWSDVYAGYPKNAMGTDDLPAPEVFRSIFGTDYDKNTFGNACATRLSLGLLNGGINFGRSKEYNIQMGQLKGKGVLTSAVNMINWLKKNFGKPDVVIENPKQLNDIALKIGDRKGIYAMLPRDSKDFGASGHVTLWHKGDAIGKHNYFESAKVIYFWELK